MIGKRSRRAALRVAAWVGAAAIASAAATAGAAPAVAQTVQAGELTLDLTGRVQFQASTTTVGGDDLADPPPVTAFELRRVRIGTAFAFADWLRGKVEADFTAGGASLTDGYADLVFGEPFVLRVGQFRKPFGVFELESSTKIRTIERAVRIRGLEDRVGVVGESQWLLGEAQYLGRQVGVMLHGDIGPVGYAAGVFNGEGANTREERGSKAYAGRATVRVAGPLELGMGLSAQPTGRFEGGDEVHGFVYGGDVTWGGFRRPGLHVTAEAFRGDNPLRAPLSAASPLPAMTGVHGVVAWFAQQDGRVEGVEPVFRLGWADPDTETAGDDGLLVTPGVNLYFTGRNRVMLNGDVYVPAAAALDVELAVRAQVQVYF